MAAPLDTMIRVTVGMPDENKRFLTALQRVLKDMRA